MKSIALLSGGLDSLLAVKIVAEQGVGVLALNFQTPFCTSKPGAGSCGQVSRLADLSGIELKVLHLGQEYLDMVARPKHGWGRNMNPCIDCRIMMLKEAARHMEPAGARFVVTGEVLGQRPMSQHMAALKTVEKESGLEGLILRPLSAKVLAPTVPETEGWVDREKLLAIQGRSRKDQFALAKRYGIAEPPTPAGGCLLTDPAYSARLKDVLKHAGGLNGHLAAVIRHGRYVRLGPEAFVVVGRNEEDNRQLEALGKDEEWFFGPVNCMGPVTLGVGAFDAEARRRIAGIVARYSDRPPDGRVEVEARRGKAGTPEAIVVKWGEEAAS